MRRVAGMAVHLFTSLGAVCAMLAAVAMLDGAYELMFVWLLVALVIDAVDGTLARAVDVKTTVPRFCGDRLDLVVDFVTYVFLPVIALLHAGILAGWVGQLVAALILLSALYHFADTESKAADHCFVGFPAVWNLVAFCLFAWSASHAMALLVSLMLVGLAFVPLRWLHPFRVARLLRINLAVSGIGVLSAVWILAHGFPAGAVPAGLLGASALYFVVMAIGWSWIGAEASPKPPRDLP